MQHFSIPANELTESLFEDGIGFDGSSIRGFQGDPGVGHAPGRRPGHGLPGPVHRAHHAEHPLLREGPVTGEWYSRDPRYVARKAELYLKQTGIADLSYWGPEAEFYIFDSIRFDQNQYEGYYHIDAAEGVWNSGASATPTAPQPRLQAPLQGGLLPVPPMDHYQDLRSQMVLNLEASA